MQWEGYSPDFYDDYSEATLEPHEHIKHCSPEIDEYFSRVPQDVLDDVQGPLQVIQRESGEVLDKHLCIYCGKLYKRQQDVKAHHTIGCDGKPRSQLGTRADKYIQRQKRMQMQEEMAHVMFRSLVIKELKCTCIIHEY